ncbi:NUDIX domain-containing protein [Saccharopolyspora sp. 6V]|uniref:NUDIX domain-containing protein n=1 Tax=Saccharopolyspora sp. 6V TaxID=2877239 RepID=UPI001CD73429|nr:NUDIX domain-containing protein [Saccharopolyspora sp. 6V]MCA1192342.1 NUDIX domain-containing protein [Saccharopolyspora sp. 6V]
MSVLRSTGLVAAPLRTVGAALRHTRTAEEGLRQLGIQGRALTPAAELLVPGDDLAFRWTKVPAARLRTRIVRADADRLESVLIAGPLQELRHESVLAEAGGHTLLTDSLRWTTPFGALGRLVDVALARRVVLAVLARRMRAVGALAESWAARPVVVGTAITRRGRLLVQQRRFPARDAGRWELPGGRVEPGESEQDAVVRECKEELDVEVVPTGRVGTDVPLRGGMLLRVHTAELADPGVEPRAVEHRAVCWATRSELGGLDWLEADQVLAHSLRELPL